MALASYLSLAALFLTLSAFLKLDFKKIYIVVIQIELLLSELLYFYIIFIINYYLLKV